ncbi:myosin phosphatase Rho-interacting protein isoform X3 [Onychostoma macrolepis]|uniref:myosin phosphatase Rho-interacting protein isoform X3 n=1 Tax=Onychostoma macrolepis TaxID=369639 RepID=UPI00272D6D7D|nr:myosin phosphatase Rho-interacting protein isoform X3 [Onychostoma macrolepis]
MFSARENRCHRFQANIFNKSKCQNCFKTVDSHKLREADLFQTKPLQVGWLLLAPEDTDFNICGLRKRKWQRRYFVLYEHGLLRYSLDEMPGTLPQGIVNMSQCCEVLHASSQTGFQNCLRLCFSDRDYYIRTESTDSFSISRWQENLIVYPKAAKSNQKKKGKDPAHPPQQIAENQTSSSSSSSGGAAAKKSSTSGNSFTCSIKRQGSIGSSSNSGSKVSISDNAGSSTSSATKGSSRSGISSTKGATRNDRRDSMVSTVEEVLMLSSEKELEEESHSGEVGDNASSLDTKLGSSLSSSGCPDTDGTKNRLGTESGYSSLEKTSPSVLDAQAHTDSRSQEAVQQEGSFPDTKLPPSTFTTSSTEQNDHKTTVSTSQDSFPNDIPDHSQHLMSCSLRSKSLERRSLDSTPAPDLLNFKKGWMSRLGEDGKWRKHWFVLTDQTLRFYRDSAAEEAADVDGEINLSTCFDVTDYPVQRNYGFQIHTKDGVFTLCAMTYGIRRNWVQAVMKNIRPAVAPDVTWKNPAIKPSSIPQKVPMTSAHARTSSCQCSTVPQEAEQRSRIRERRREGRYKTFDWAELSCKQQKEELSNDPSGRQWNHNSERSVPPAPASSPEGQITRSASEASENEYLQKKRIPQRQSLNIISADISPNLSLMAVSSRTSPESISPDSLEVDAGTIYVHCDGRGELLEAKPKEEKQVDRSTSPLPVTFSSSSAQTEWQWDVELQSLRRELKAEHERNQTQERELRLSEARLQAALNESKECLQKTELKIQETEALLKEREEVLESLRGRLEEVTGRLKATEEAQALKEVRLQRHLRLLQESQERERRSFSDSLDQSEQRSKELEERLRQKEAELQKRSTGDVTDELLRRCQELQNQQEESDSEVCRLQARLQTEETLYYDMEHDYERACEEIQSLRGALLDCERVSEERFQTQLVQQQQELDRKERELQEVLLKMAILGSSLEETEQRLKEAQTHSSEANVLCETLIEPQQCRQKGQSDSEMQPTTQADESHRVISVIQALERKLCDTEERLRELTMHLQQQQQLHTAPHALNDSWCSHSSLKNPEGRLSVDGLPSFTETLHSLQGTALDTTSDKTKISLYDDEKPGSWRLAGESSGRNQALEMASRVLSLEALIIQKIASALEHPSSKLLNNLSEVHVQVLRMAQGGSHNGAVEPSYSQIFSDPLEQDLVDNTLSESAIHRLCVRAEMTYLIHTLCTHPSQEQKGSDLFYVLPWPESSSSGTKMENCSKQGSRLADISPPELAPYSEQIDDELGTDLLLEGSEVQLACRKSLVAELRAQAQSLQNLSTQLQSNVREVDLPGELPSAILRAAICQAILAYMACRLRSALQQEMSALRKQREQAECECRAVCRSMETLFQEQTERYEEKLREERVVVEKAEQERVSAVTNAQLRTEEAEKLQLEFEEKLQELQKIHEEEMNHLHEYYIQNLSRSATLSELEESEETEQISVTALQDRIRELETEVTCLRVDLSNQDVKAFQLDLETIKATYEHGFSIMEDSHQRVIEDMQRQHQKEVERLTEERERVLQEETNATIAAIEAMRKAHKEEMDKTQKALQNGANVDIRQLRAQYNEELETLHRELEVLSEQYSQKFLENTHLNRTIETEREALSTTQRENQELRIHNQELNEFLAAELSLMHSRMNGEVKHSLSSQEKDVYQLEVHLRVKESEIKCLKQEINSLKLELQAGNTYFKELDSEPVASEVKAQSDFTKLRMVPARQQSLKYDLMKSRSNPDFPKDHATLTQPVRSKSLKDGLTVLERMKLFELTSTQKI